MTVSFVVITQVARSTPGTCTYIWPITSRPVWGEPSTSIALQLGSKYVRKEHMSMISCLNVCVTHSVRLLVRASKVTFR